MTNLLFEIWMCDAHVNKSWMMIWTYWGNLIDNLNNLYMFAFEDAICRKIGRQWKLEKGEIYISVIVIYLLLYPVSVCV